MSRAASVARGLIACAAALIGSCASQADHFYALETLPDGSRAPAGAYDTHVLLSVSLPALVDRRQMVVDTTGDQVSVLEHERWAAPMPELVQATLARDIERRRAGVLVGDSSFDQSSSTLIKIRVDVVQMSARRGGRATLEAHWRVVDATAGIDVVGGELFTAPLDADDYAAIARGFSVCLSSLADRLIAALPVH
ncbi:MAG TPA: PqiC family protein [Steroidobacteraceae bacterium]|nr:PqiC family protein [Steroidobacteraceae bacterium]